MSTPAERYVPKIHPATRPVEAEDPFELFATPLAGDPEVMLRCLVQEYAWMGWNTEQILGLFRNPFYPALYGLLRVYGETGIRTRVAAVLNSVGVFRFDGSVVEEPAEPELIQLGILPGRHPAETESERDSHANGL
jgi:hypothetical protein